MPSGERHDPYINFNFLVEIDGITQAGFMECSGGLRSEVDVVEYREGGYASNTVRKLAGLVKYSNITLKWGITDSTELYQWHRDIVHGIMERKNGAIILLDRRREEKARWNFIYGWPVKWIGPDFDAASSNIAIETLEIAHEGIERAL